MHTKYLNAHGWVWVCCCSCPSPAPSPASASLEPPNLGGTRGSFSSAPGLGCNICSAALASNYFITAVPTQPARCSALPCHPGCVSSCVPPRPPSPPTASPDHTWWYHGIPAPPASPSFIPVPSPPLPPSLSTLQPGRAPIGAGGTAFPSPPRHSSGVKHKSWQGTPAFSGLCSSGA